MGLPLVHFSNASLSTDATESAAGELATPGFATSDPVVVIFSLEFLMLISVNGVMMMR